MVADEIESKMSAKTRLYKGIQRRIDRPEVRKDKIEIYEEDDYENEGFFGGEQTRHSSDCHLGDKNETLTMSVRINNSNTKKVNFLK